MYMRRHLVWETQRTRTRAKTDNCWLRVQALHQNGNGREFISSAEATNLLLTSHLWGEDADTHLSAAIILVKSCSLVRKRAGYRIRKGSATLSARRGSPGLALFFMCLVDARPARPQAPHIRQLRVVGKGVHVRSRE